MFANDVTKWSFIPKMLIIFPQLLKLPMLFLNCVFSPSPTVPQTRYKLLLNYIIEPCVFLYFTFKLEFELATPLL